ncbi:YcxB family protein [Anaerocaecibacter muris]|uniref:YcxB family protein n=1 Tax=Anaerocaecibacter muris TaxID=2941513 RepID=UPI003F690DF5
MFRLNYKITDGDIKAVNKKFMLFYFVLYLAVAVVGLTVGVIAVVLDPSKLMFVLGIILLVLGGILLLCSIMLLIAPKNFVASAIKPSDDDLTVSIDENGIAVQSPSEDVKIPFASVTEVRDKKQYLLVYTGKDVALMIKNAIASGQTLPELNKFLSARRGGLVNPYAATESDGNGGADGENPADDGDNAKD